MANQTIREAIDGGDDGVWADFEQAQNHAALSLITAYLYNDAGALKLSKGKIGLDNGSNKGTIIIDTVVTLGIAGLTTSCWAAVEAATTGSVPSFTVTSIGGATDPTALPAGFTGAYDGEKGGYYITGTKRVIGLGWINSAGALEGIVNCLNGLSYSGYSTSDDTDDYIYQFRNDKGIVTSPDQSTRWVLAKSAAFTAYARGQNSTYPTTTAASSFNVTVPLASTVTAGKRVRIPKVDTGAGVATVIRSGADTFGNGATAFPLRSQGDFIELESNGSSVWRVIDSLSTTADSAALAVSTVHALAHGTGIKPRTYQLFMRCTSTELNYAVGDEVPVSSVGDTTDHRSPNTVSDATNISFITDTTAIQLGNKTTTAATAITMNKWVVFARYSL